MKKLSVLFVSALALGMTFTSCNKDDDNSNSGTASIEGKWMYAKTGEIVAGVEEISDYGHECTTKKDYIEFVTGGVANDVYHAIDCVDDISTGGWVKNGNNVAITFGTEGANAEILTLNSSTLKIKYTDGEAVYVEVFTRM